ncbi:ead/Ea22-like family protein [Klebsiella pneumoniae]|uniref:ead/Ea22-like family protein n=1 Tax=Klebsiella pneumoniae TaxID=573 RepID=UPI00092E9563|nr:ead/Ea22-like family protein [Klebsiella pneumoniae]
MTDITELAQSLKAAAEKAIGAHERLAAYPYDEIIDISQQEGEQIDIDIADINEFLEEASPANVLALVEALEKAQAKADVYDMLRDDYGLREKGVGLSDFVDWQANRIAELEESHAQVIQSRDHYKRMTDEGLRRLAESRSVKLPDDEDGQAYGFGKWANGKPPATAGTMTIAYCEDAWRAAFEVFSSTAGIKVEAE